MSDDEQVAFWFPEWSVLCTKYKDDRYSVINGDWDFIYDTSTGLRRLPNEITPDGDVKSYPIMVTKTTFKGMGYSPSDYFW